MLYRHISQNELLANIKNFIAEDYAEGDISSQAIFSEQDHSEAYFIARESMVCAGIETLAGLVFSSLSKEIQCQPLLNDGARANKDERLIRISCPTLPLLAGERTALNLCQRLCGIASLSAEFVEAVRGIKSARGKQVEILDTRKTTPGLRALERYAVRMGGGKNHRFNLGDGILIKDNHIAAAGTLSAAVAKLRAANPKKLPIEVECENLEEVKEALHCRVEIIMLDNMRPELLKQATTLIAGQALSEASGGVRLDNVREIAGSGVDRISIGALTHSAAAKDISMEIIQTKQ